MAETTTNLLDGTTMQYTYEQTGTVEVFYKNGRMGYEWMDGPLKGESGEGFIYRAREVGKNQYFVSWHEPELPGFVTLYIDFVAGRVHSSVLAAYATEDEQIHFDTALISQVERAQRTRDT